MPSLWKNASSPAETSSPAYFIYIYIYSNHSPQVAISSVLRSQRAPASCYNISKGGGTGWAIRGAIAPNISDEGAKPPIFLDFML